MSNNIFINGKWDSYCPKCNELQKYCCCIQKNITSTSDSEVVTKDKTK